MQFLLRLLALMVLGAALAGGMLAALAVFVALPNKPPSNVATISQPVSSTTTDTVAPAPVRNVSAGPPSEPVEEENTGLQRVQSASLPVVARTEEITSPPLTRREARRARRQARRAARHARREAFYAQREERRARLRALREARRAIRSDR